MAWSPSSPSASPYDASSRTSASPPRPRRPPGHATRPTTSMTWSLEVSSNSGLRRGGREETHVAGGRGRVRLGRAQLDRRSRTRGRERRGVGVTWPPPRPSRSNGPESSYPPTHLRLVRRARCSFRSQRVGSGNSAARLAQPTGPHTGGNGVPHEIILLTRPERLLSPPLPDDL